MNNAIDTKLCSLEYITMDNVADVVMSLGVGALIAKKSAYRLIPVCPADWKWLGMQWQDRVYVDGMLPFGLRSAPKIFNAVADALEWCVKQEGVEFLFHCLAVVGPPNSRACHHALDMLKRICAELGVPLAPEKQAGPSANITFLGITIDTMKQELRLPHNKLEWLIETVSEWASSKRKWCTRRELESLIGVLHHATKVIHAGRSFMRRAIALFSVVKKDCHHIRLSTDFRSDMMWWKVFASSCNGCSAYTLTGGNDSTVTSDVSGSWGCGA